MGTEANLEVVAVCALCGSRDVASVDPGANMCACRACGYIFDSPRPTTLAITAFYSRPTKYDGWMRDARPRDRLWQRRVRKLARHARGGSLLDVGAGIGQFLHHARRVATDIHGTEISTSAIAIARDRYGLTLTEGPIETAPLGRRQFDTITLFHVLEHVPNPRSVIERCYALLAPGGVVVIAVPNDVLSLRGKPRKIRRLLGRLLARVRSNGAAPAASPDLPRITLEGGMDEIHLSHFTPEVLQRFLEATGFTVIENGLDPFYVAAGVKGIKEAIVYAACGWLQAAAGVNIYDAIWIVARKSTGTAPATS